MCQFLVGWSKWSFSPGVHAAHAAHTHGHLGTSGVSAVNQEIACCLRTEDFYGFVLSFSCKASWTGDDRAGKITQWLAKKLHIQSRKQQSAGSHSSPPGFEMKETRSTFNATTPLRRRKLKPEWLLQIIEPRQCLSDVKNVLRYSVGNLLILTLELLRVGRFKPYSRPYLPETCSFKELEKCFI